MPPPPALLSKDLEIKRAIWEGAGRACAVPPPPAGPAQWARPGPTRAPGGPRSAPARPGPGPYVRPPRQLPAALTHRFFLRVCIFHSVSYRNPFGGAKPRLFPPTPFGGKGGKSGRNCAGGQVGPGLRRHIHGRHMCRKRLSTCRLLNPA